MKKPANKTKPAAYPALITGIGALLEESRRAVVRAANCFMTATYWEVGRRIVEFEQGGKRRAEYGEELLEQLSRDLTERHGRGFSRRNLQHMRWFYLAYSVEKIWQTLSAKSPDLIPLDIWQTPSAESPNQTILPTASGESSRIRQTKSGKSGAQILQTPSAKFTQPDWGEFLRTLAGRFPLPWSLDPRRRKPARRHHPLLLRQHHPRSLHPRHAPQQSHGARISTRPPRREKARSRTRRHAEAAGASGENWRERGEYEPPDASMVVNTPTTILTQKSPAWKYEQEVRMIYDLPTVRASQHYAQPKFACDVCRKAGKGLELCENLTFRDALRVPPEAMLAVILGTDISKGDVVAILGALDSPDFARVRVYWSSLHADRYVLQYNRDDKDAGEWYSLFMQEERERQTAQAKGHVRYEPNVTRYIAAKKTVNYVPKAEND